MSEDVNASFGRLAGSGGGGGGGRKYVGSGFSRRSLSKDEVGAAVDKVAMRMTQLSSNHSTTVGGGFTRVQTQEL